MANSGEDTTCPFCKEEVKADATKCKHCKSAIGADKPQHEGKCPYCKEDIKPEAVKCKHCQSMLVDGKGSAEGCDCETPKISFAEGFRGTSGGQAETLRQLVALRAGAGRLGGGFGYAPICDWDCTFDWGDCMRWHSRVYCDQREQTCLLLCRLSNPIF